MVRTWKAWLLTAGIAAALARGGIRADEPAKPAPDKPAAPATDKPQPPAEEPKRDAPKPGTDKPEVKAGASDVLDDVAEPFVPAHPRSGREEDRVRALALFAAARVAEQKQDYPLALRNYERALRFDPDALPALREIVPLAFNLDRQAEAVRYALVMAEQDPTDSLLLRRLALHLTEEGDTDRALALYEKALSQVEQAKDKPSAGAVLMRMEMGRLYFLKKQYDDAARQFAEVSKAIDKPQDYGLDAATQKGLLSKAELTYQLFGEGFLEAGRGVEALAAFEKSNQVKADEALHLYNLARVDGKQKQPAQGLAKLEAYLDKHSAGQGTAPYQLYADLLGDLGQGDQLFQRLEKFRAADPENMPLAYFLAQQYRQADELDKAEPIYTALIERHKSRPPIEAYQGLLDVYRQKKDAGKMLEILEQTVGRGGSLAPLGASGLALAADADASRAVIAAARQQLETDATKIGHGARLAAALLAIELKDFAAADALFDATLKAEGAKPAETLVTWGLELFVAGQYADAAKVFERGLAENLAPKNAATLNFYLASSLEMIGRTDEAVAAAQKAAQAQPDSARFASRVPWIEYHAKRYDAARKSYSALVDKFDKKYDSSDTRDVMHEARLVLSNICVLEGKLIESEEWVEQVLDEFPEDAGAMNDLGYLWADAKKHLELAARMIKTAVQREPKNMAYRDSLGWVYFRLGKTPEAVAELKVAAAVEEPDAVVLDHLADALMQSGEGPAAIDAWTRAVAAFEKSQSEPEKAAQVREKIARVQNPPAGK
jgi:tetratricopeptide (TPR) repeat protein